MRRAVLSVVTLLALTQGAAELRAQGQVLPALASDHPLIMGGSRALGDNLAQMRLSFDGRFVTAVYDDRSQRFETLGPTRGLGFAWDASFDMGQIAEIGGRLRLSYEREGDLERVGLDLLGVGLRVRALEDPEGPWLTVGLALGQELDEDPGEVVEMDVVFGAALGSRVVLDAAASAHVRFHEDNESRHGVLAVGPVWQAADWLRLSLDAQGRYGERAQQPFWDVAAALRFGAELGSGHELALSGWHTLYGQSVQEQTVGLLTWRVRWQTDDGLLRLDNDGEMLPAELIETTDESTPTETDPSAPFEEAAPAEPEGNEPEPAQPSEEPASDPPTDVTTAGDADKPEGS